MKETSKKIKKRGTKIFKNLQSKHYFLSTLFHSSLNKFVKQHYSLLLTNNKLLDRRGANDRFSSISARIHSPRVLFTICTSDFRRF